MPMITEILLSGGVVSIKYTTTPGLNYKVEFKNDLNAGMWTQMGANQPAVGATLTAMDTVNGNLQRFYRVARVPQRRGSGEG